MKNISNIKMADISSQPLNLCYCNDGLPDCIYQHDTVRVSKGEQFSIELVAVDQVHYPTAAIIYSTLQSTEGGLGKGQETQNTSRNCSRLHFNVFSPNNKEELIMYAEGPCLSSVQSQRRIIIEFTDCNHCPIGFQRNVDKNTNCECVCDLALQPYITICNESTKQLERKGKFWLTYINTGDNGTSGFLLYPYCPLNYCVPPTYLVQINLNIPNGSDVQCAYGRSGMLCGTCRKNLSLSIGSSRCMPCSTSWLRVTVILIIAFLAGIALVTVLLVLNLTVAIGTLNGIIFYANIVDANSSTFLPFSKPNFVTVFVSWLNLDIGFDTCFFPEMDAYWKVMLQHAFPLYVIFLVVLVILFSECFTKFARLVAKKNPIATLTTLILLSYTKFLNTVILALSFAILDYPDKTHQWVWLPDGKVEYLRGKHIVLFIIAIIILLVGVTYTALLFSWQWLLQYQNKANLHGLGTKSCVILWSPIMPHTHSNSVTGLACCCLYVSFCALFQQSISMEILR